MIVPDYIKNILRKQAEYFTKIRRLSQKFLRWCEANNIDSDCNNFQDCHGYIQGDCSADEMITYLENDVVPK